MVRPLTASVFGLLLLALPALATAQQSALRDRGTAGPTANEAVRRIEYRMTVKPDARPLVLPALYAGAVALQAMDAYTTMNGLGRGAVEINPIARSLTGHPAAFVAAKSAASALAIFAAERTWRRNRAGAIALLVVSNGINAWVVQHNLAVARGLK